MSETAALELVALNKRYGDTVALDSLSFSLSRGEIFGFVGPNGAGKTTTMRITIGVLAADSGSVLWDGRPIAFADRRRIGYMPEERGLYPTWGVLEQLVYLARLHGVDTAQARADAMRWLARMDLEDRATVQLQKLSQGNQQRVELIAALLHAPNVLILDEPFAGLDPVAVDTMSAVLREQAAAGVAVLFSSHQLEIVESLCDRVGIVRHGRMVASGTVAELRRSAGRRYWIDIPGAAQDWTATLPGATVLRREGSRWLVSLNDGVSEESLLEHALQAGAVHEFAPDAPRLSELFRHVISEDAAA
ncbi:MAG: ATP-binding cassette domain-containing protein [Candidatus Dormibacteraeota bacterium]|nr:ATP-binding cassette domain-containing protein [Candidatus Dormibacteraeota bacterium]